MTIPKNIQDFFEKVPTMALSTADTHGVPNTCVIGSKKIIDDSTIYTIDTFHHKTIENLNHNPNIAISFWKGAEGYQIKGKAKYYTEGPVFEAGKSWVLTIKPKKIVKGVIEVKVTEIFCMTPSYELAGKEIVD